MSQKAVENVIEGCGQYLCSQALNLFLPHKGKEITRWEDDFREEGTGQGA